MDILNIDKAGKDAVDEAAIKLDPVLKAAITQAVTEFEAALNRVLDGRTITINLGGKQ